MRQGLHPLSRREARGHTGVIAPDQGRKRLKLPLPNSVLFPHTPCSHEQPILEGLSVLLSAAGSLWRGTSALPLKPVSLYLFIVHQFHNPTVKNICSQSGAGECSGQMMGNDPAPRNHSTVARCAHLGALCHLTSPTPNKAVIPRLPEFWRAFGSFLCKLQSEQEILRPRVRALCEMHRFAVASSVSLGLGLGYHNNRLSYVFNTSRHYIHTK